MKLTKAQKTALKAYILDRIDTEVDYSLNYSGVWYAEANEPLHFSYYCFMSEMGQLVERDGVNVACVNWLSGLCSTVSLEFSNYNITELYRSIGIITDKTREATIDKYLDEYWQVMSNLLIELWDGMPDSVRIIQDVMTRYKLTELPQVTIDTFDHGRDLYGNGTAHYICSLEPYVRLCQSGTRREQVGYSGMNDAAAWAVGKLGFKLDTSKKSSYDYEGMASYKVVL